MLKVVNNESTLVSKELKLFYCYREVRNLALPGGRTIVRFFTHTLLVPFLEKKKKNCPYAETKWSQTYPNFGVRYRGRVGISNIEKIRLNIGMSLRRF